MKKQIVAIQWIDACAYEEESLDDDHFLLSPMVQIGILFDEDKEKIRLVHSYDLTDDDHDFIVIPVSLIKKRIVLGVFDTDNAQISKT